MYTITYSIVIYSIVIQYTRIQLEITELYINSIAPPPPHNRDHDIIQLRDPTTKTTCNTISWGGGGGFYWLIGYYNKVVSLQQYLCCASVLAQNIATLRHCDTTTLRHCDITTLRHIAPTTVVMLCWHKTPVWKPHLGKVPPDTREKERKQSSITLL